MSGQTSELQSYEGTTGCCFKLLNLVYFVLAALGCGSLLAGRSLPVADAGHLAYVHSSVPPWKEGQLQQWGWLGAT